MLIDIFMAILEPTVDRDTRQYIVLEDFLNGKPIMMHTWFHKIIFEFIHSHSVFVKKSLREFEDA